MTDALNGAIDPLSELAADTTLPVTDALNGAIDPLSELTADTTLPVTDALAADRPLSTCCQTRRSR